MRKLNVKLHEGSLKEDGTIEGWGSIYGNKDAYGDVVLQGAYDKSLIDNPITNVKMLWQHKSDQPIGKWDEAITAGKGLYLKGRILVNRGIEEADKAYTLVKEGIVDGLSIGYQIKEHVWDSKTETLNLVELALKETSLVTFPANELSLITEIKSIEGLAIFKRDIEGILRDGGLSKKEALAIISHGVKCNLESQSDSDDSDELKGISEMFKKTVSEMNI